MVASSHIKDPNREQRDFTSRVIALFLLALLAIFVLIARMIHLQVADYEKYRTRSDQNRIQVQPIGPPRGLIFDRNGVLLADNQPVFTLALIAERVTDLKALIGELHKLVEFDDRDVDAFKKRYERRRRPFEPVPLKVVLTDEEIAALAVNRFRLPGVVVTPELVRHYPLGALMGHALGSVRRISEDDLKSLDPVAYSATQFVGKLGVERVYERSLHGQVGYEQVETDARGRQRQVLDRQPPVAGQNLTLQLDTQLQTKATEALAGRRGAIVAIDPRTGGILAMVSNPGYDPNLFVTGISQTKYKELSEDPQKPLFNRVTNGQYAPGSTFKPMVALCSLSLGVTNWDRTINDHGFFKLPGQARLYRDWSWKKGNSGGQGIVDLTRAIYRSSNVYFFDLGSRLNINDFAACAAKFGYGRNTSFDVQDALAGRLPDPVWKRGAKGEPWYPGDTINMSVGQGDVLVTPLQLATVAALIANRGHWVRPRLLLSSDQALADWDPPPPIPDITNLVSTQDWERLVDAMEMVVHRGNVGYGQSGTAFAAIGQGLQYRMAGKSGTAQVVGIKQGETYDEKELGEFQRKHAWFIAFAPADAPQIAVSVLVENGGGGSAVAAPVARQVIDAYLLPLLGLAQR
jgi:penicillin-binding protein 2